MPKLKTHRGAAKRFKKTGTGKFRRGAAFKRHILTSKTTKRKRSLRGSQPVSDQDSARIARIVSVIPPPTQMTAPNTCTILNNPYHFNAS